MLPLRWETHSAPEYGRRPQEVINRQVVDNCDLLVGIFWTRVGSPTGVADSGTLEEIERVASQGKPVMLYFSQVKQDPDRIDLEQLGRLREFKKKNFPRALIESYSSQIEFRDKLSKQLEIQLRSLIAEEGSVEGHDGDLAVSPITDIQFEFADAETGQRLGSHIDLQATVIDAKNTDNLPELPDTMETAPGNLALFGPQSNKRYYHKMVEYIIRRNFLRPVRFWLKNAGGLGARDVYVDLQVASNKGELTLLPVALAELKPPSKSGDVYWNFAPGGADAVVPEKAGREWRTHFEVRALQPQREISPSVDFVLGQKESATVTITANIYADTLSAPVSRELRINLKVRRLSTDARQLLTESGIAVESSEPAPRGLLAS